MHMSSFEPTVMFFGMTNLSVTFQAIMNEILRDLINKGKVTAFVDNILVETKMEKGHNKIMEKKVRKIGFLGVVIGPNRREIEKEKVNKVLS